MFSSRNQLPSCLARPGVPSFRGKNRASLSLTPRSLLGSRWSRFSHRSNSPLRLGFRSCSSGPKVRRGRPLFQSSLSPRRLLLLNVPNFPSRRSESLSPNSRSLKNFSRKLNRSFFESSWSLGLDDRSVASIDPLPGIRDAEAKAVFGGPRMMSSMGDQRRHASVRSSNFQSKKREQWTWGIRHRERRRSGMVIT